MDLHRIAKEHEINEFASIRPRQSFCPGGFVHMFDEQRKQDDHLRRRVCGNCGAISQPFTPEEVKMAKRIYREMAGDNRWLTRRRRKHGHDE